MGPTIIYNVPARTGQDIPPPVMQSLAESPNFAGVKECVGNERVGQYAGGGLTVWSGNDDQCHDARWDFGARGVISVVSNLVPGKDAGRLLSRMMSASVRLMMSASCWSVGMGQQSPEGGWDGDGDGDGWVGRALSGGGFCQRTKKDANRRSAGVEGSQIS